MSVPAEDRYNLRDDIESEIFTLDELSAIYEVSEAEIISAARRLGCSAILLDGATDEYLYL
jgi:hypothetical protein